MGYIQSIILGFCQNIDNVGVTYWFLFEIIRKDITTLGMIKTIVFFKFSRIKGNYWFGNAVCLQKIILWRIIKFTLS